MTPAMSHTIGHLYTQSRTRNSRLRCRLPPVKRILVTLAAVLALSVPVGLSAKGGSHTAHAKSWHTSTPTKTTKAHSKSGSAARNSHGRIKRSAAAKHDFMKQSGYRHGRPGYVVDHIVPLACGGADAPSNMQWQSAVEAKAKDRVERKGC